MTPGGRCTCFHHKLVPILIILLGLAFLLENLNVLTAGFVGLAWPVLLILVGVVKIFGHGCKCCSHG